MDYDRWDALLHHIFKQTQGDAWFRPQEDHLTSGVAIRINDDELPEFRVFPYENASLEPFEAAVRLLNPVVAVKIRSAAVHAAISQVDPGENSLYIDANTCIQVVDTMIDLGTADKEQSAAFIRDERVLVVWASSLDNIIPTCQDFEERLIKLLWRSRPVASNMSARSSSATNSVVGHDSPSVASSVLARPLQPAEQALSPGSSEVPSFPPASKTKTKRTWYGKSVTVPVPDSEKDSPSHRPTMLYAPLYNGIAAGLAIFFIGNGMRTLLFEFFMDGSFMRFALCATFPLLYCVSLFFALQILQNVTMAVGPIAHYHRNSKYYSAIPPPPIPTTSSKEPLPHITIQMPVYKESLETVLKPSVASLKAAMRTYALQGGTSSLFVFDDGLRASGMTAAARNERIRFYRDEGIGWCARPREGCPADSTGSVDAHSDAEKGLFRRNTSKGKSKSKEESFHRPGRFKKASNMNYGLALSLCVERWLEVLLRERDEGKRTGPNPGPTLQQLVGEEQRMSEIGLDPTNLSSSWGRKTVHSSYGMQYLNREGDEMVWDTTADSPGSRPISQQHSSILSPVPRTATMPLLSSPFTPGSESSSPFATTPVNETPTPTLQDDIEEQALQLAIEDMYTQSGGKWKPWAANARAMRVGEIVLLVDSDTEVPEDCLRDAAREMHHSPSLAIIQHESDVMQVAHHYFENGIAYFTRRVNKCIGIACANGEVAPFVGHNAFLRWRAIQDAAFVDTQKKTKASEKQDIESKMKMWSEWNVSEDFDMALRLLKKGYTIRWATYAKGGFKEGVSLTVDDELNRWMKYAYGCNE
ncbi:hypothetical protein V5O48_007337 [Marasmius crinis-equi]|uniref:Glycosyltransferase 2-like domain-containing protein n=1 Tax=Marasmius crinis-equi TaxID=585013 RepID=A0ABR3FH27_9AGAR